MRHTTLTYLLALASSANAFPIIERAASTLRWGPCELPDLNTSAVEFPLSCAELEVPLDYTNPDDSVPLLLQLIKVNATKEPFLGSVLFNPGGPGGTGVDDMVKTGPVYNDIIGGQYDLIGFDPRGTGRTIPFACALNWTEERASSKHQRRNELFQTSLTDNFENQGWKESTYAAEQCYKDNNATGAFMSTAFVVRDMFRIVDALNEGGMLRFWGGSYGTLLGQTAAAMFPDRIDRMELDSEVDAPDYMNGTWLPAMETTEKSLKGLFSSCISAGPELCPIANFTGPETSPETLMAATNAGLLSLLHHPYQVAGLASQVRIPGPADNLYEGYKGFVFAQLYHAKSYAIISATMYGLMTQNFTVIEELDASLAQAAKSSPAVPWNLGPQSFWGIGCSEAAYRAESPSEMYPLVQKQEAVSGFADAFYGSVWPCAQWKMKAAERYEGDFKAKTNFPILFINGEFDPATPHSSAEKAVEKFEGSVLLTHGGHGHKFFRHPSRCTSDAVKAYFVDGKLPAPGTYCKADLNAFEVIGEGAEGAGIATA